MTSRAELTSPTRRELLAREEILVDRSAGGDLRFHLVYPNQYWVGMSNLGFQAVYSILASEPSVVVERGFLPEEKAAPNEKWRSFESNRLLADANVVGFSLSFETDYPNVVKILKEANLLSLDPEERARRADNDKFGFPLLVAGGTGITLNPEPIADLFDVMVLGEAEELLREFMQALRTSREQGESRKDLLRRVAAIEGIYVPSLYSVSYQQGGSVEGFKKLDPAAPERPFRRYVKDLSAYPTHTKILSPDTEFKSMFMTETGRGCEMGCRFCVAGYIYRPVRKRSEESLQKTVDEGLKHSKTIGFVGASVSSHRAISNLAASVAEQGGRASLSSIMAQKVTGKLASSLSESEYKTVALAPEAGSERLRRAVGKRVDNATFLRAAQELSKQGIRGFKLYFIVGLPTEQDEDVDALAEFALAMRDMVVEHSKGSGKVGWVVVSLNPFIPKAVTPFQWEPMNSFKEIERKIERVQKKLAWVPNLELKFETPKESYFQAVLSRGDRRIARLLVELEEQGKDWKWLVTAGKKVDRDWLPPLDYFVTRRFSYDEVLPWDIVDPRVEKSLLRRENERAHGTLSGGDGAPVDSLGELTPELVERAILG